MNKPTLAILVTVVWGVLLFPGLAGAVLSPMFFDAPGSTSNPVAWINAAIVVSFPCLCILSIAGSWIVQAWRKRGPTRFSTYARIAVACLPLLPIVYVVAVLAVGTIGVILSGQPLGLHSTIIEQSPTPRPVPT